MAHTLTPTKNTPDPRREAVEESASTASTASTTPNAAPAYAPPSSFRQALTLLRTEFKLFVRYKTALLYLILPAAFMIPFFTMENEEVAPGVTGIGYLMSGSLMAVSIALGLMHPSNVLTTRRENLVLKRLRVGGVSPSAIHGSMIGLIVVLSLGMGLLYGAVLIYKSGHVPSNLAMMLAAMFLSAITLTLLGTLITPLVRNGEIAQMAAMVPMLLTLAAGGVMVPLVAMPDSVAAVLRLLPIAPAVDMLRSGFLGMDYFGHPEDAEAVGALELWILALPSIGVQLVWIAVLGYLVHRFFRWDPRKS
ncbi:ABC transporter permease [Nocardiopsis valliformis]|uniref:ABC transporter permease n=1 Tax=Nocardiopsis valliformis TaxID=239974 RepID=UPI0003453F4A|nr:ABC transporter permease [Nocardiopsis valliformis]